MTPALSKFLSLVKDREIIWKALDISPTISTDFVKLRRMVEVMAEALEEIAEWEEDPEDEGIVPHRVKRARRGLTEIQKIVE